MSDSARYAGVGRGVARFRHWWKRELLAAVPPFVSRIFRSKALVLSIRDNVIELIEDRWRGPKVLASASLDDDQELAAVARRAKRMARARGAKLVLRLSRGQCLIRSFGLPIAPGTRLEAMVKLELERMLPNQAGDFAYGWVADELNAKQGRVPVDLVVVKRSVLVDLLQRFSALRLKPDRVDCWRDDKDWYRIDFMEHFEDFGLPSTKWRNLRVGLVAAAVALLLAAPILWSSHRAAVLSALNDQIDKMRMALQSARAEGEKLNAREAAVTALVQRRTSQPMMIEIWAEIARILPDTAYAEEIALDNRLVTIDGRARSAAALVPALELSPLFKLAGLSSAVVLDPDSGLERFTIRLTLEQAPATASIPTEGAIQ
jgi:Tfp pilus assembly protein PilN